MKLTSEEKEKARLKEADTYKRLKPAYSEKLQDLAEIAGICFSAPIVYISIIEEFKQLLLAKKGIAIDEMQKMVLFSVLFVSAIQNSGPSQNLMSKNWQHSAS